MNTPTHRGGLLAAALTAAVFGLTACSAREAEVESEPPAEGMAMADWTATIRSLEDDGHDGTASATVLPDGRTRVTVTLSGGSGGGDHPWHVHRGTCGSDGEIVGDPEAYPTLRPDMEGDASETATIDTSLDPSGSYYINVHQSPERLDEIVGCGELREGG